MAETPVHGVGMAFVEKMVRGEAPHPPIADLIGLRITAAAPGEAHFELDAGPQHANPLGVVHGGVLCEIADLSMGAALATLLGPGESFTTMELHINFLRSVVQDRIHAISKVVRRGRSTGYVECEVFDSRDRLVAKASSSCLVLTNGVSDTNDEA